MTTAKRPSPAKRARSSSAAGTREPGQRQQALRSALISAGLERFHKQGFDATTADEIAQAAGTSRRTFFRYFASKDDVVFDWVEEQGRLLSQLLSSSAPDQTPIAAVHESLLRLAHYMDHDRKRSIILSKIVFGTPQLDRRFQAEHSRWENEAVAILQQRHPKADVFAIRVQMSAAASAFMLAVRSWAGDRHRQPLLSWVKKALLVLERGAGR